MKLVYKDMGHILSFDGGYVNELVIENKKLFFETVNSVIMQTDGIPGNWVLSVADKPVELHQYADVTIQFAPFQVNRKSLLTKLYNAIEQKSVNVENYIKTSTLICELKKYILQLAEDLPFELNCKNTAMGPLIRALALEIEEADKSPLERIFAYMELVRELDRDRLFVMVNMRSYFSDKDMNEFTKSACLHDFKVLLLGNVSETRLENAKRYTVDADLCEF